MRWLFRIFFALLVGLAIVVAGLFLVPNEQVARLLENQIEAATGREVTFEGKVTPSIYPRIGLRTGPVRIANASWSQGGPILEADGLNVAIDLVGLLQGDLLIGDITAIRPRLLLETAPDGKVNWDVFEAGGTAGGEVPPAEGAAAPKRRISLENLSLTDAAIRFVDRRGGGEIAISDLDLVVQTPDFAGATDFTVTYKRTGKPITLKGRLAKTEDFVNGVPSPVKATLTAAGARIDFDGEARIDGSAAGRVNADVKATRDLLEAIGLPGIDLPKSFGRAGTVRAAMRYGADNTVAFDDLDADLEGTRIRGKLAVDFAAKPRVTGRIATSALDFAPFMGGGGGGGAGGGAVTSGWSKAPIDASALAAIDADIALSIPEARLDTLRLAEIDARVTIDNARGVLDLARARGYGGTLAGQFVANNRGGLSVRASGNAQAVDMRALLGALVGWNRLAGTGSAQVNVLGVGQSVDAIMRSLKGDAALEVKNGEIFGLTLAQLFLNQGQQGGSTIFDSLTATFTIKDGVASNNDLALQLPQFAASGKGLIDLGRQTIDYRITPTLPRETAGREIIFPVTIKGPWAAPKIRPDVESAIRQNFDAEIQRGQKKVEETVRKKVEEKVGKELGVQVQEGQSIEDTVKQKAEEELKKGILNLLNQ